MIRALIIIAIASFVLTLACFAGAAALGGRELAANGWVWPDKWTSYGVRINGASEGADAPDEVRDISWSGTDTLQVDLTGDVEFTQSEQTEVRISGPAELIKYVTLEDGRLSLSQEGEALSLANREELRIQVFAPSVRRFVVNGPASLSVESYKQENISVEVNGSGKILVEGEAKRLAATVSGSGAIDLEALQATDANIKVVGSGDARVAATGAVQVAISGSGDVHLLAKPASLTSEVAGSGDVHEAD